MKHIALKKSAAMLAAGLCAVITAGMFLASCDYWGEDWYKNGESSSSSGGSVTYGGTYVVDGKAYSSLTMTGTDSSGTVVLAGDSGSLSGSYASTPSAASAAVAARALSLNNGSYTLSFGDLTMFLEVSSGTGSVQVRICLYLDSARQLLVGMNRTESKPLGSSSGMTIWRADTEMSQYESNLKDKVLRSHRYYFFIKDDGTWGMGILRTYPSSSKTGWASSDALGTWSQSGNKILLKYYTNGEQEESFGVYPFQEEIGSWYDSFAQETKKELLTKGYVKYEREDDYSFTYSLAGDKLYEMCIYKARGNDYTYTAEIQDGTMTISTYSELGGQTYAFSLGTFHKVQQFP